MQCCDDHIFHSIMNVGAPNEQILGVTVIFSWVDDNVVKKYIGDSPVIDVITVLWGGGGGENRGWV